jgi:hypothetical protein
MLKKISFLLLIFSLFSIKTTVNAQNDLVNNKIIHIGTNDNQTMNHLDVLCNRFGGRLIGSAGFENAAEWAKIKFEEWGLEVELDEAGEVPVGFNRGPWFGRLLGDNAMPLHFATPSYTSGTQGLQRGHVLIEPKSQAEFDSMKKRLKGAWVLISGTNTGWPIDFSENANEKRDSIKQLNEVIAQKNNIISRENWMNRGKPNYPKDLVAYVEEPALFYKEMCEAGILGIIQSSKIPIRVLYDRKNIDEMTFETLPTVPDIKLDEHQYNTIEQMAKERRYFQLEFDIRNHFKIGPVKHHNVIAKLVGSKFPDEYVIMGAHLDAFDVATGGVDDGSGVSVVMEAARLLMKSGAKPKRTILFVLFSGEEFGLLGSKSWVERNPDKLASISNMFNRDGGPTVPLGISVTEAMKKDFEPIATIINEINPDFPFELNIRKPSTKPTKASGTDAGSFAVKGVPTVNFSLRDPKGYNFSYGEIWHTERDLYTKSIPEYQNHASIATAIMLHEVANLDHLLSREGYYIDNSTLKTTKKTNRKN